MPFSFTVADHRRHGLAVTAPGVYPLMVNVNGAVMLDDGPLEARIGELHLLLTVMGVPTGTGPARCSCQPVTGASGTPLPVNFVWPVVDRPHLGVGGVFLNEDLLAAISPGGRLSTLVDGLPNPSHSAAGRLGHRRARSRTARRTRPDDHGLSGGRDPGSPQPSMTDILQQAEQTAPVDATPPSRRPEPLTPQRRPAARAGRLRPMPGSADIPGHRRRNRPGRPPRPSSAGCATSRPATRCSCCPTATPMWSPWSAPTSTGK